MKVKSLSHVRLLATPWTVAYKAPLSMGFSRQEYWSGLPLPSPKVSLYSSQASAFNTPIKLPLLSFPMIPLPGLWTFHYSFRCWTLLPRHWAPSPPFRDPALHFSFYFSVSFAPLRRPVEYELPQCHPGLQPSQFIPTQGPLSPSYINYPCRVLTPELRPAPGPAHHSASSLCSPS